MSQAYTETAHIFPCEGADLIGILHRPKRPRPLAVVIVVGGPQYRVGSHRHFVELARALAADGFATFRFDYRGMGDSEGEPPGFENAAPDIAAAMRMLRTAVPEVTGMALWGLCDAVPPIARAAATERRIRGVALLNPWAREGDSHESVLLRHYYRRRLFQRDFWATLLRGRTRFADLPRLVLGQVRRRWRNADRPGDATPGDSLAGRTIRDLRRFRGRILLVMSGQDITAREFDQEADKVAGWSRLAASARLERHDLTDADHTFSDPETKTDLTRLTRQWLTEVEAQMRERHAEVVGITTPPPAAKAKQPHRPERSRSPV